MVAGIRTWQPGANHGLNRACVALSPTEEFMTVLFIVCRDDFDSSDVLYVQHVNWNMAMK